MERCKIEVFLLTLVTRKDRSRKIALIRLIGALVKAQCGLWRHYLDDFKRSRLRVGSLTPWE